MKVESIYKKTMEVKPFEQYIGFCPVCQEMVKMDQYGRDEECPDCGAELEWDFDETETDYDWQDDLERELEYIRESDRQMQDWLRNGGEDWYERRNRD